MLSLQCVERYVVIGVIKIFSKKTWKNFVDKGKRCTFAEQMRVLRSPIEFFLSSVG